MSGNTAWRDVWSTRTENRNWPPHYPPNPFHPPELKDGSSENSHTKHQWNNNTDESGDVRRLNSATRLRYSIRSRSNQSGCHEHERIRDTFQYRHNHEWNRNRGEKWDSTEQHYHLAIRTCHCSVIQRNKTDKCKRSILHREEEWEERIL